MREAWVVAILTPAAAAALRIALSVVASGKLDRNATAKPNPAYF